MRLYREKIRRAQVQIQLNLATAVKDKDVKGKSCLTDLISSFVKIISLKSCGCGDVVYLDFSKAFDTVSYSILKRLAAYGLDRCTVP